MIKEVRAYSLFCDNCNETYIDNCNDYSIWLDESIAIEDAMYEDWIEHEGKHYCPSCYEIDEDDNIIIKESEDNNG